MDHCVLLSVRADGHLESGRDPIESISRATSACTTQHSTARRGGTNDAGEIVRRPLTRAQTGASAKGSGGSAFMPHMPGVSFGADLLVVTSGGFARCGSLIRMSQRHADELGVGREFTAGSSSPTPVTRMPYPLLQLRIVTPCPPTPSACTGPRGLRRITGLALPVTPGLRASARWRPSRWCGLVTGECESACMRRAWRE